MVGEGLLLGGVLVVDKSGKIIYLVKRNVHACAIDVCEGGASRGSTSHGWWTHDGGARTGIGPPDAARTIRPRAVSRRCLLMTRISILKQGGAVLALFEDIYTRSVAPPADVFDDATSKDDQPRRFTGRDSPRCCGRRRGS